jgi:hypothetical protein
VNTATRSALVFCMLGILSGCAGETEREHAGLIRVNVEAFTRESISRLHVSVAPAGLERDLAYDAPNNVFAATLTNVAIGQQTVVATAFAQEDGVELEIGSGTAEVEVTEGATASVFIRVYETTDPSPVPDRGPLVLSLSASKTNPLRGEPVALTAIAIEPDDDPMTYAWSDDCPGEFAEASSAVTTWTPSEAGVCTITVTVSSRGLSDARSVEVVVFEPGPSGAIDMTGEWVGRPEVASVCFPGVACVSRTDANASITTPLQGAALLPIEVNGAALTESDSFFRLRFDCGAAGTSAIESGNIHRGMGLGVYYWPSPSENCICEIEAEIVHHDLSDTMPIAVRIAVP